jgi:hypothetical protein
MTLEHAVSFVEGVKTALAGLSENQNIQHLCPD